MPKATPTPPLPLSALFAIQKPAGHVSMTLLNRLQPLFQESLLFKTTSQSQGGSGSRGKDKGKGRGRGRGRNRVKMGQGGTLDPLADGVLVVGTNSSTKHLSKFLHSSKTYIASGLLGYATDSYDADGRVVSTHKWNHVTRDDVESALQAFRGTIKQTPPIYSALKMDGKPLYEYARSGTALPRPIEARECVIHSLELLDFKSGDDHAYTVPPREKWLSEEEKQEMKKLEKLVKDAGVQGKESVPIVQDEKDGLEEGIPPIFTLKMEVSSGTYVRSIIHDIGIAINSAAFVVRLTRTRQGEFVTDDEVMEEKSVEDTKAEGEGQGEGGEGDNEKYKAIGWGVFEEALEKLNKGEKAVGETMGEWMEWERAVLENCKV